MLIVLYVTKNISQFAFSLVHIFFFFCHTEHFKNCHICLLLHNFWNLYQKTGRHHPRKIKVPLDILSYLHPSGIYFRVNMGMGPRFFPE